jgi:hypothetical protein
VVLIVSGRLTLDSARHLLDGVAGNPPGGLDYPGDGTILPQGLSLGFREHGGIEVQRDLPLLRHDRLLTLTLPTD